MLLIKLLFVDVFVGVHHRVVAGEVLSCARREVLAGVDPLPRHHSLKSVAEESVEALLLRLILLVLVEAVVLRLLGRAFGINRVRSRIL